MKDRVREAVFNLVGPDIKGMHAIDLFAGTGALALEALSRGAAVATCIEQHFPTADVIRKNAKTLEATERITIIPGNTFIWSRRRGDLGEKPWAVFCSPPYAFWVERQAEMLNLLNTLLAAAPNGSIFVVEADEQFDMANLPIAEEWDVRVYPPAFVAIRKLAK